jgi:hypothetical protein
MVSSKKGASAHQLRRTVGTTYVAEFDFRYSYRVRNGFDDTQRAVKALEGLSVSG